MVNTFCGATFRRYPGLIVKEWQCTKLTHDHIYPDAFSRMNVNLAVQVSTSQTISIGPDMDLLNTIHSLMFNNSQSKPIQSSISTL